jgi:metal-responsive CopG/Arc/MetJ family transcriptional regulator
MSYLVYNKATLQKEVYMRKRTRITFLAPVELSRQLRMAAARRDTDRSKLIREICIKFIEREKEKNNAAN